MDNQQTPHDRASNKAAIAGRLRLIRMDLFGENRGTELADQLRIPFRTWFNYETGVTIPGEVLLELLEITGIEPLWLLRGTGPKFRVATTETIDDTLV